MLEISILIALARHVHRSAEQKGYPGTLFAAIAVVAWFGGGIVGCGIGLASDETEFGGLPVGGVIGYLVGVAVAGTVSCMVVSALPEGQPQRNPAYERRRQQDRDEWEYVERRRRGERPADEDEVVPLTPARANPPAARPARADADPPRAKRAWRPKW